MGGGSKSQLLKHKNKGAAKAGSKGSSKGEKTQDLKNFDADEYNSLSGKEKIVYAREFGISKKVADNLVENPQRLEEITKRKSAKNHEEMDNSSESDNDENENQSRSSSDKQHSASKKSKKKSSSEESDGEENEENIVDNLKKKLKKDKKKKKNSSKDSSSDEGEEYSSKISSNSMKVSSVSEDDHIHPIKGLQNLGNTCFFNSVTQCLVQTPQFAHFFIPFHSFFEDYLKNKVLQDNLNLNGLASQFEKFIKFSTSSESPEKEKLFSFLKQKIEERFRTENEDFFYVGDLTAAFQKLIFDYYNNSANPSSSSYLNPGPFFKQIIRKNKRFAHYDQQDSLELLQTFLNSAHEEFSSKQHKGEENTSSIFEASFGIKLTQTIQCQNCQHISRTKEPCWNLSVPIPKVPAKLATKYKTLDQLFEAIRKRDQKYSKQINAKEKDASESGEDEEKEDQENETTEKPNLAFLDPNVIQKEYKRIIQQQEEIKGDKSSSSAGISPFEKGRHTTKSFIHFFHCLWTFFKCDLLKVDTNNGYYCENCSNQEIEVSEGDATEEEESEEKLKKIKKHEMISEKKRKKYQISVHLMYSRANSSKKPIKMQINEKEIENSKEEEEKEIEENQEGAEEKNEKSSSSSSETEENEEKTKKSSKKIKKVYRDAVKQYSFDNTPSNLIIHIKRFSSSLGFSSFGSKKGGKKSSSVFLSKEDQYIEFPESFDLNPFLNREKFEKIDGKTKYSLYGVVEHHGGLGGGHYVSYLKLNTIRASNVFAKELEKLNIIKEKELEEISKSEDVDANDNSKWYYISDSSARAVNLDKVLQAEAYLLFYRRL